MSLSLDHEDAKPESRQKERFAAFAKMFGEGRSFSGHESNCCYLNPGNSPAAGGKFANISAASGLDYPDDARAIALLDWDQDGDLDVWASNRNAPRLRLLRNEIPKSGHFVSLQLVGNGTTTSRDAIGARVEVILAASAPEDSPRSITTLRAGEGFLSQNSKSLHFGLGNTQQIDKVVVSWPGGQKEIFSDVQVDTQNRLVQGTGTAQPLKTAPRKIELTADTQILPEAAVTNAIRLITPVAMPSLPYQTWDGTNRSLQSESKKPTLVILWASWCMPCLEELKELAQAQEKLRKAGINIIALSVDGVGEDKTDSENSQRVLKSLKFPFASGRATEDLLFGLQRMHDRQAAIQRPLPLPTSLLLSANDELVIFYKGPLEISELLNDLSHLEDTAKERIAHSASIPGRVLDHKTIRQVQAVAEAEQRFKTANLFQKNKLWRQVLGQYDEILNLWDGKNETPSLHVENKTNTLSRLSDSQPSGKRVQILSLAYAGRGQAHEQLGQLKAALEDYEQAMAILPQDTQIYLRSGNVRTKLKDFTGAVNDYTIALEKEPESHEALMRRAAAYKRLQNYRAAVDDYGQVLRISPETRRAYIERAKLFMTLSTYDRALEDFSVALGLNLQDAETLTNRGSCYGNLGQSGLAQKDFAEAIRLNPRSPIAYNNLGWLLATCADPNYRNGKQAVLHARKACELLDWKSTDALDTLAAACAEVGRFEEALKWQNKAIDLAPDAAIPPLQSRLDLYRSGKPYRDRIGE